MSRPLGPTPRIGIDVTAALTQGGGIGRYTRELVQALAQVDKNSDYHLFSAKPPDHLPVLNPLPTEKNFTYHPSRVSEKWLYRLWYRLNVPMPVQWFTGRLDLFHSPDFVLPPTSGNIPTLLTVHDLSFHHYPEHFTRPLVNYLNRVVPRSVARATHILADSEATKDDLMTIWGVAAAKITVLYSGVNPLFKPVEKDEELKAVRQKYGLGNWPYLVSVSTVQPRKNYQMLIRAFKPLTQSWPHHLVIAGGKGWLYEDILAEAEKQGLQDKVHFLGFVADADLPALYTQATLMLFPSFYEGFGLPLLEAMACGVPVLSSDASCLPEVAGNAGRLLSPHEEPAWTSTMHKLLLDGKERGRMVAEGFRQARQFTWKNAARQLVAVYQGLLGSKQ